MNFVLTKNITKNRISSAVILGGGYSTMLGPLTRHSRIFMLPVLNRPFIEYTIESLKDKGIKNIIISSSGEYSIKEGEWLKGIRRKFGSDFKIQYVTDNRPRGTAGALSDLKDFISKGCFLVLSGNIYLGDVDLDDMLKSHITKKTVMTVGVKKAEERLPIEGISIGEDNTVKEFSILHSSRDRRSYFRPMGVYIFDPAALKFIKDNGYFDIKEQLIPALNEAKLPVHTYEINGCSRAINSIDDYYDINRECLSNGFTHKKNMMEIAEQVWAGSNVSISPSAYILGPTIIGNNCKIEANAEIIGPTVIGDNCIIGERTKIRESIVWNDVVVGKNSMMRYCIAGEGLNVISGVSFSNKILTDGLKPGDVNLIPRRYKLDSISETGALQVDSIRHRVFSGLKRLMDVLISAVMLIFLLPLMGLIALAIKMDSDGSVIFRQKRCGKDGKDFEMLKFRTMVSNAHAMQQKLESQKNVDGPMFKLLDDPRVTHVGSILRKTSLDELPQLINVLKGEMSLVGPRPLAMNEMKFSPSWRSIRLRVKPGITGLWQVQGRSEAAFHNWIKYDVQYVRNQTLWLDIKILLRTIAVVFRKIGAY